MYFLIHTVIRSSLVFLSLGFSLACFAVNSEHSLNAYQKGDYQTAFAGWSYAAQQGDSDAYYYLGEHYRLGLGVEQDYVKAESYYIKAAKKNQVLAQLSLGKMYYFDDLGANKKQGAFYWLSKAAEQNNPDAQFLVGGMLFNGDGVVKNPIAAYSLLTLADQQNHLQAARTLVVVKPYLSAEQLERADNLTAAFKTNWAANSVINKQQQEAFYWFHQAAQKNDVYAQWRLGEMLLNGQGVDKDVIAAYSWLTLASEKNYSAASLALEKLKTELSHQQINLADSLTTTFKQGKNTVEKNPVIDADTPQQKKVKRQGQHYRVQVAAFKSHSDIETELIRLHKKIPTVMSEQKVTVTKPSHDLNKSDYYRIHIGSFDNKTDAKILCQDLTNNKQACFVVKATNTH